MFYIISKLHDFADKFDDLNRSDLADRIDKIAAYLIESYTPRFKRQRRSRGVTRVRRKQYYRQNRPAKKRYQKIYRRKWKSQLQRRRKRRHFKRIGFIF
jgi:hypothetical protein